MSRILLLIVCTLTEISGQVQHHSATEYLQPQHRSSSGPVSYQHLNQQVISPFNGQLSPQQIQQVQQRQGQFVGQGQAHHGHLHQHVGQVPQGHSLQGQSQLTQGQPMHLGHVGQFPPGQIPHGQSHRQLNYPIQGPAPKSNRIIAAGQVPRDYVNHQSQPPTQFSSRSGLADFFNKFTRPEKKSDSLPPNMRDMHRVPKPPKYPLYDLDTIGMATPPPAPIMHPMASLPSDDFPLYSSAPFNPKTQQTSSSINRPIRVKPGQNRPRNSYTNRRGPHNKHNAGPPQHNSRYRPRPNSHGHGPAHGHKPTRGPPPLGYNRHQSPEKHPAHAQPSIKTPELYMDSPMASNLEAVKTSPALGRPLGFDEYMARPSHSYVNDPWNFDPFANSMNQGLNTHALKYNYDPLGMNNLEMNANNPSMSHLDPSKLSYPGDSFIKDSSNQHTKLAQANIDQAQADFHWGGVNAPGVQYHDRNQQSNLNQQHSNQQSYDQQSNGFNNNDQGNRNFENQNENYKQNRHFDQHQQQQQNNNNNNNYEQNQQNNQNNYRNQNFNQNENNFNNNNYEQQSQSQNIPIYNSLNQQQNNNMNNNNNLNNNQNKISKPTKIEFTIETSLDNENNPKITVNSNEGLSNVYDPYSESFNTNQPYGPDGAVSDPNLNATPTDMLPPVLNQPTQFYTDYPMGNSNKERRKRFHRYGQLDGLDIFQDIMTNHGRNQLKSQLLRVIN